MTVIEQTTRTLNVPGATLAYDIRHHDSDKPTLFLIGSPMGAAGFRTLASHFTDRTVATYDPRGTERSTLADPTLAPTPEEHADDLHRVIEELGGGRVDMFASSGGAVNALALVARHPADVHTLVAQRQNEDMKKISGWAAILFAPTLIAAIYGMNFDNMPELHWALGYPVAIGGMVLFAAGLYGVFKWRKWF